MHGFQMGRQIPSGGISSDFPHASHGVGRPNRRRRGRLTHNGDRNPLNVGKHKHTLTHVLIARASA